MMSLMLRGERLPKLVRAIVYCAFVSALAACGGHADSSTATRIADQVATSTSVSASFTAVSATASQALATTTATATASATRAASTATPAPTQTRAATATATVAATATAMPTATATPEPPCPGAIDWSEAAAHVGQIMTVRGPVIDATFASASRGQPTFLDIGRGYPDPARFTVVIWIPNRDNFPAPPEELYLGQTICVTGQVTLYNGSAEMEIIGPEDVQGS
jgi:hypothetical protein